MRNIISLIVALLLLSVQHMAIAGTTSQAVSKFIEGSYIVTFRSSPEIPPIIQPPIKDNRNKVPFGEHSTGQNKADLAAELNTTGTVVSIYETINAAHIKMDAKEAEKLSKDKRVLRVEQDRTLVAMTTQTTPGWGLDRLDSATPALNSAYSYTNTGAGQTIYILDSGLNLSNPTVAAEFGGRASIIYDYNGGAGYDCHGHGTGVASIAAGNTYGVAKGANLIIAKITMGCTIDMDLSASINAFNWLAVYAPAGTIVNWSFGLTAGGNCSISGSSPTLESAIIAAHNKGIIVVVAAGNDGCDTTNYSPTNIPQSFVVGATHHGGLPGQDRKWNLSRTGWNISTFAPGFLVPTLDMNGGATTQTGTSFAAPYIAGIFAVACQAYAPFCNSGDTTAKYDALRGFATWNTVTNYDGTPLTGAYSRFIRQQW